MSARVNWNILAGGLVVIVPLLVILNSGFGKDPHALPSVMEGKEAPAFSLEDLDGNAVDLTALRGRPVVLNFWSTWCGPCKYEHPLLLQAARANPDVVFLGVLYQDDPTKARAYLAAEGTAYPTLVDATNRVAIDYGVTGVPETFFIHRDGSVAKKVAGPVNGPILANMMGAIR